MQKHYCGAVQSSFKTHGQETSWAHSTPFQKKTRLHFVLYFSE